jgi:predicted RNA-binding protein (virulence factor B family)
MIQIGDYNKLTILRDTEPGLFLGDSEDQEVLLPNRYVPDNFEIGEQIDVFVYLDNKERPVAVTDHPYIKKSEFALLRCNSVNDIGAFLDWGLVKELFCPFREQAFPMKAGGWYLVFCYLDETSDRLVDEVDLIVSHPSDLGMNVIVNKTHLGLIFNQDLFKDISVGDKLKGIIKKIRSDNKLDITLEKIGYRNIEPNAQLILEYLENDKNGFIKLTDKSSPEAIKSMVQMSKKSFKKAVGTLYKQRRIRIELDGIYLIT